MGAKGELFAFVKVLGKVLAMAELLVLTTGVDIELKFSWESGGDV